MQRPGRAPAWWGTCLQAKAQEQGVGENGQCEAGHDDPDRAEAVHQDRRERGRQDRVEPNDNNREPRLQRRPSQQFLQVKRNHKLKAEARSGEKQHRQVGTHQRALNRKCQAGSKARLCGVRSPRKSSRERRSPRRPAAPSGIPTAAKIWRRSGPRRRADQISAVCPGAGHRR